jgi:hypothetical protein
MTSGSAYGSAACGRAVLRRRGLALARAAKDHEWHDIALCSNLVCFQNMRADPHVAPVVAEIARVKSRGSKRA